MTPITSFFFAIFTVAAIVFMVISVVSFQKGLEYGNRAKQYPKYAREYYMLSRNKYLDTVVYFVLGTLCSSLAIFFL